MLKLYIKNKFCRVLFKNARILNKAFIYYRYIFFYSSLPRDKRNIILKSRKKAIDWYIIKDLIFSIRLFSWAKPNIFRNTVFSENGILFLPYGSHWKHMSSNEYYFWIAQLKSFPKIYNIRYFDHITKE